MENNHTRFVHGPASRWLAYNKLGYDILECDKIIIPVHQKIDSETEHWVLVVVNIRNRRIEFLNSYRQSGQLHKPGGLSIVENVLSFMQAECEARGRNDMPSWTIIERDVPQQADAKSCG
eukprot:6435880-Pyramimonas_sp.AAC.1